MEIPGSQQRRAADLEREIAYLRRKLQRSVQQQMVHEAIHDNLRSLLKRIHSEHQHSLSLIEEKNRALETLTRKLNRSHAVQVKTNKQLRVEIRDREQAEAALRESEARLLGSLAEKEVLLGEIHHRVKNNLQVIMSLLQMTLSRSTDENVRSALSESCSRVNTMALIHSQLYQSSVFSRIDMRQHIQQLIQSIETLYGRKDTIDWEVNIHHIFLPVTQAIPLALAVNEILTNAFKHAFGGRRNGRIRISMEPSAQGELKVTLSDNGRGLSKDVDVWKTETLGLKLVRSIVQLQMKGRLAFFDEGGLRVEIVLPGDPDE